MLSLCPFDVSVSIRAFVIGLKHISSFILFKERTSERFKVIMIFSSESLQNIKMRH